MITTQQTYLSIAKLVTCLLLLATAGLFVFIWPSWFVPTLAWGNIEGLSKSVSWLLVAVTSLTIVINVTAIFIVVKNRRLPTYSILIGLLTSVSYFLYTDIVGYDDDETAWLLLSVSAFLAPTPSIFLALLVNRFSLRQPQNERS